MLHTIITVNIHGPNRNIIQYKLINGDYLENTNTYNSNNFFLKTKSAKLYT